MRRGFWLRGLIGLVTAAIGVLIAWAGFALTWPARAGLSALPPQVGLLPFDRGFWSVALMLLGVATILHALPHPFWMQTRRRTTVPPAAVMEKAEDLPIASEAEPDPEPSPETSAPHEP